MAKKLNTKVAIIGIILLVMVAGAGVGYLVLKHIRRDPNRALKSYEKALAEKDYLEAEKQLGRAYAFGKTDKDKIDRLFELADFHLIQNDQHEADWSKAMRCWNSVISIDTKNIKAREILFDYFYQVADTSNPQAWRNVDENASELIEALRSQGKEPDDNLLTAQAKALLSIASRGETTNRREILNQSIELLTQLNEKEPQDPEYYQLLAEAKMVEGELDMLDGVLNAVENAQKDVLAILESSVESSEDKPTAVANLMWYKLNRASAIDPNAIQAIRDELDKHLEQLTPNDKLWRIVSMAYENPGKADARAELNRAIEAIRRAHELDPENFEYVFQMSRLLYRKGNSFNDPAAKADALQIAEDALLMDAVKETAGPLRGRNFNFRFGLNDYLSEFYLTEALEAKDVGQSDQARMYIEKASPLIEELASAIGATDNPRIQKYHGLLALAEGDDEKGIRLLYKAYEQNRTLDKSGEASNVDATVAAVLAKEAEKKGLYGLQSELYKFALSSRDRYALQHPEIYLDYAETVNNMRRFSNWAVAVEKFVQIFQGRYGVNDRGQKLLIEAAIGSGQLDKAKNYLASFNISQEDKSGYELNLAIRQISRLKQTISLLEAEAKEPSDKQTSELQSLRQQRDTLLPIVLSGDSEIATNLLGSACMDLMENGQVAQAIEYLTTYLEKHPDSLQLIILRLQAQQDDPLNLSAEKMSELQEQGIDMLKDPKQKALIRCERYRMKKEYDKALDVLENNPQIEGETDWDIVQTRFELLLDKGDFETAENLYQIIRSGNLDRCEGSLAGARLELAKENYGQALRRLDEVLAMHPLMSDAYYLKSQVQNKLEEQEDAIESAITAIRMNPLNPFYARNLASILFARDKALGNKVSVQQRAETQQAFLRAIQLNPSDTQLLSVYAETIQDQDPDRALGIRRRIYEDNPTGTYALMLGNMAMRMARSDWDEVKKSGLYELAGKVYAQGLDTEPDNEMLLQAYADYLQITKQGPDIDKILPDKNMQWSFYLRSGQFDKAEALLKELHQENPEDLLLLQGLVTTSQGAGKRGQVKQYLDMISRMDLEKETELWVLQKLIDAGFTEDAEKQLASFKDRFPDDSTALLIEAWTLMSKGRLDEALAMTNRYMETNTNNPGAWRLRGRIYRLMNQPRKAVEDLQRSKSLSDSPEVRMELSSVYVALNQETAAIGELMAGLDDPQTPLRAILALEALYQKYNRTTDLEKMYRSMLDKYPTSAFWHYRAGIFYQGQKDFEKAQQYLKASWDMSHEQSVPNLSSMSGYLDSLLKSREYDKVFSTASDLIDGRAAPLAYLYMALAQVEQNKTSEALKNFSMALEKAKTNDRMQQVILFNMVETVGEDAVSEEISSKLSQNPQSLAVHQLAASFAQSQGLFNKAIEHMEKCIEVQGKDNPDNLFYEMKKINLLILAYVKTSDKQYLENAVAAGEELLKLQPTNASLLNNVAFLLADNGQQLDRALEYARKAHQSDPGNAVYLDTYGYALCKKGEFENAKETLLWSMQAYEVSGQAIPWDLYKHLAMAHEGLEENEQAVEMYRKAVDASEDIPEKEKQQLEQTISRLQQL